MSNINIYVIATLIIFLSSCSENKYPIDLDVGDCFIDLGITDEVRDLGITNLVRGRESIKDTDTVDVVTCSEPHNGEVILKYSTVPEIYRTIEDPIEMLCGNETVAFLKFLHPNADDSQMDNLFRKFDERFSYTFNFVGHENLDEPNFNERVTCAIVSLDSLLIGNVDKIIRNFDINK